MAANRTLILARRVIQQMLGDRRTLAMMVVIPVFLLGFVSILIRADEGERAVAVVNDDAGLTLAGTSINLGERLVSVMQDFDEFETRTLSADAAHDQLADGDLDAVITVPADFTQSVMQTRELVLPVEFEGSNPMLAENLDKLFQRVALQAANTAALAAGSGGSGSTVNLPVNSDAAELSATLEASYLHGGPEYDTLDYMAPALIGFFVFFFTFLLTSIAFLRERVAGTLERLQATPIRPHEVIVGYMLGFLVFGLLQGLVALLFTVYVLDIHYAGNLLNIFVVVVLLVAVSVNVGIFLSTFAQNEFQVLQFIPLVITTQGMLGGIIWQIEDMPGWLQPFANVMPLTYATRALRDVMIKGETLLDVAGDLGVIVLFALLVIALSSRTAGRARI